MISGNRHRSNGSNVADRYADRYQQHGQHKMAIDNRQQDHVAIF